MHLVSHNHSQLPLIITIVTFDLLTNREYFYQQQQYSLCFIMRAGMIFIELAELAELTVLGGKFKHRSPADQ